MSLVFDLVGTLGFSPTDREAARELTSAAEAEEFVGNMRGEDADSETGIRVGARDVYRAAGAAGAGAGVRAGARDLVRWPLFCLLFEEGISRPLGFCAWTGVITGAMVGASAITERATIKIIFSLIALSFPLFSITVFT